LRAWDEGVVKVISILMKIVLKPFFFLTLAHFSSINKVFYMGALALSEPVQWTIGYL